MTTIIEITKDMNNGGYEYCNISLPDGNLSFGYEEYNHHAGDVYIYRNRYLNENDYNNAVCNKLDELKENDIVFYSNIIKNCINNGITKWGDI